MLIKSKIDLIGNTPLMKLEDSDIKASIVAKLDYMNPSGSTKDRIAKYMVEDAEREGVLKPGKIILEASTGNTAIALAFVGAVKGYKVKLFVPKTVVENEKLTFLKLLNAEVEQVDTEDVDSDSVHGGRIELLPRQKCLDLEQQAPEKYWWARQFSNKSNARAHYDSTGKEIVQQLGSERVDAFVTSIGTAGTFVGIAKAVKEKFPEAKLFSVEPTDFALLQNGKEGIILIDGISGGLLLEAADLVDEVLTVNTQQAVEMSNKLAAHYGILCGISSGANYYAAKLVSDKYPEFENILTIFPDRVDRYFTTTKYTT